MLIAICSSYSCCTFRGENESTETSRKSSATLSTSGHWGTFPTFHRRHKLPTQPVNKPQLLPIPARTFLQMDKHSFYSGQTARYPDKHLQHHATFSTRHHPTETTLPTKTCYLAQHIEGFGVVGPSSFGSHTLSSVARCFFLRVVNETHITLTSLLTRDDKTTQSKQTNKSLFIRAKLTSTDKQPL